MKNKSKINQKEIKNSVWFLKYICIAVGIVLLSSWSAKASSFVVSQQELQEQTFKEITGVVKTEYGEPIPNVAVLIVGTNEGTETDEEGKYNLNANEGDNIQFVYEGFKTTTVIVGESNILNVTMIEDDTDLSNIIIEYYIKMVKDEMGCGTKVYSDIIVKRPPKSIIYGSNYGVSPLYLPPNNHLEKNRNLETILKDVEALTRNGNYTYVVDGIRVSEETFRSLNQNDIESIDVYKHSDITQALYGNKESQSKTTFEAR